MKKVYLTSLLVFSFILKICSQNIDECYLTYESAIKEYIKNPDSIELKNKLDSGKINWKNCLLNKIIPSEFKINDTTIRIDSNSVYLLQFWASWCSPCVMEISIINKLTQDFKNQNVIFLTFSYDENISFETRQKFLSNVITNTSDINKKFSVLAYPTIYIVSKKSTITNVYLGTNPEELDVFYMQLKENIVCELEK